MPKKKKKKKEAAAEHEEHDHEEVIGLKPDPSDASSVVLELSTVPEEVENERVGSAEYIACLEKESDRLHARATELRARLGIDSAGKAKGTGQGSEEAVKQWKLVTMGMAGLAVLFILVFQISDAAMC